MALFYFFRTEVTATDRLSDPNLTYGIGRQSDVRPQISLFWHGLCVSTCMLRMMLFEEPPDASRPIGVMLTQLGHTIVGQLADASALEGEAQRLSPDVIVVVTDSPSSAQLDALAVITRNAPRPILLFAEDPDRASIVAAVRAGASAYVVGAPPRAALAPILDAALARFEQLQAVRAEAEAAKAQLQDRKLVERAKGILMKSRKLSEDDAYRAMRKQAMDRKLKLTEVARQIIAVADLLG